MKKWLMSPTTNELRALGWLIGGMVILAVVAAGVVNHITGH